MNITVIPRLTATCNVFHIPNNSLSTNHSSLGAWVTSHYYYSKVFELILKKGLVLFVWKCRILQRHRTVSEPQDSNPVNSWRSLLCIISIYCERNKGTIWHHRRQTMLLNGLLLRTRFIHGEPKWYCSMEAAIYDWMIDLSGTLRAYIRSYTIITLWLYMYIYNIYIIYINSQKKVPSHQTFWGVFQKVFGQCSNDLHVY